MNWKFSAFLIGTAILYAGGFILGSGIEQVGLLSGFQAGVVGVAMAQAAYNLAFLVFFEDVDLGGGRPPPEPAAP